MPLPPSSDALILNPQDEHFFQELASEIELPPQLPPRPAGRSIISDDGDEKEHDADTPPTPGEVSRSGGQTTKEGARAYLHYWHYIPAVYITARVIEQVPAIRRKLSSRSPDQRRDKRADGINPLSTPAGDRHHAPSAAHDAEKPAANIDEKEAAREKNEMSKLLDSLNLTFSKHVGKLSNESSKVLEQFTQVLKDLVNGVPTAYDDLESLLTNKQKELDNLYDKLPPYLQTLVKSLPTKMYQFIAPQLATAAAAAAAAEKGKKTGSGSRKRSKAYVPGLKDLLAEHGAVVAMLRSILNFLRLRFPALLGSTNVLMSLAVFLLLFVFWYCHKRGREVRQEHEAAETLTDEQGKRHIEEQIDEATAEAVEDERHDERPQDRKGKGKAPAGA